MPEKQPGDAADSTVGDVGAALRDGQLDLRRTGARLQQQVPRANVKTTVVTLATASGNEEDLSLAIGTDGLPIIAYRGSGQSNLKIVHCSDPTCATASSLRCSW